MLRRSIGLAALACSLVATSGALAQSTSNQTAQAPAQNAGGSSSGAQPEIGRAHV